MAKITVIVDDEDADFARSLIRVIGGMKIEGGEAAAAEEVPTTTRRSRASAVVASPSTEPASDAGASDGRRRRRGSAEEAPAAEEPPRRSRRSAEPEPAPAPAEEAPRRRRRTEEPAAGTISDADLAKAAGLAAEKLTPKGVMQILKEDHNVDNVSGIPQGDRRKFLDTLKFECEG